MNPERVGRAIAIASMVVSALLATAKIYIGLKANSTAVVSDGLESAGDLLASGLVFFGLLIASKPPDEKHPYGHGRVETLSGLIVGMMLVASGALISFRSMERASEGQHAPAAYAMWPLVTSIAIKGGMSLTKRYYARKIGSSALLADAWNDGVDILSGVTALAAVAITLSDPVQLAAADHIGGAAVGVIIIVVGFRVVRDTTLQLMDTMPDPDSLDHIRQVGLSVPGVLGVEKCFARKTGLKWHVDLHLEVDPEMSVFESHEIATQAREKIKSEIDWVADVLVHVEPHLPTRAGAL